jgi:hypothetical protein
LFTDVGEKKCSKCKLANLTHFVTKRRPFCQCVKYLDQKRL